jgi:hypothetical protein
MDSIRVQEFKDDGFKVVDGRLTCGLCNVPVDPAKSKCTRHCARNKHKMAILQRKLECPTLFALNVPDGTRLKEVELSEFNRALQIAEEKYGLRKMKFYCSENLTIPV